MGQNFEEKSQKIGHEQIFGKIYQKNLLLGKYLEKLPKNWWLDKILGETTKIKNYMKRAYEKKKTF